MKTVFDWRILKPYTFKINNSGQKDSQTGLPNSINVEETTTNCGNEVAVYGF